MTGVIEAIFIRTIFEELGYELKIRVWSDSGRPEGCAGGAESAR